MVETLVGVLRYVHRGKEARDQLWFFPFILTFNFCTGKEEEGKNDVAYSDFIFAFKLLFALEGRRENEGQENIELW